MIDIVVNKKLETSKFTTYPSSLLSSLPECSRIDKKKTFLNNTINFSSHIIIQDESIISCTLVPVSSCKLIPKKKKKPSLSTYNDLLEIQTHEYDHNSQLFQRELAAMDQQLKKKLHRY